MTAPDRKEPKVGHTPGPFWTERLMDGTIGIRAKGLVIAGYVAIVHTKWARPEQCAEQEANAEFLASAPALAAEVEELKGEVARLRAALKRCKFDSLNMSLADLEFCRAALARAEGDGNG